MKSTILILSTVVGTAFGFSPVPTTSARPSTSLSFFGNKKASASTSKSSPLCDEAVEIYTDKFLSRKEGRKKFFFENWGVPSSAYSAYRGPESERTNDTIFDREAKDLADTFNVLASLYGDEEALDMVKIQPGVLSFNQNNFGPALDAFGEKFGYEESKEMIMRNPGLLATNEVAAEAADDLTMQLSYVIDVTRPIGKAGPIAIASLLLIPVIEGVSGVTRADLLSSLLDVGAML